MDSAPRQDLVILVADKSMESAVSGLLSRHQALQIRPVASTVYVHPHRDPGCRLRGHEFLRSSVNDFEHAILMFDREGCGKESASREELELEAVNNLSESGWGYRGEVIVIDPELDVWFWSDSPHVDQVLGWKGQKPDLKAWLRQTGFLGEEDVKPERPKEAMKEALKERKKPRSASMFRQLAEKVSFARCTDPAFLKLKETLQRWFPEVP